MKAIARSGVSAARVIDGAAAMSALAAVAPAAVLAEEAEEDPGEAARGPEVAHGMEAVGHGMEVAAAHHRVGAAVDVAVALVHHCHTTAEAVVDEAAAVPAA